MGTLKKDLLMNYTFRFFSENIIFIVFFSLSYSCNNPKNKFTWRQVTFASSCQEHISKNICPQQPPYLAHGQSAIRASQRWSLMIEGVFSPLPSFKSLYAHDIFLPCILLVFLIFCDTTPCICLFASLPKSQYSCGCITRERLVPFIFLYFPCVS